MIATSNAVANEKVDLEVNLEDLAKILKNRERVLENVTRQKVEARKNLVTPKKIMQKKKMMAHI